MEYLKESWKNYPFFRGNFLKIIAEIFSSNPSIILERYSNRFDGKIWKNPSKNLEGTVEKTVHSLKNLWKEFILGDLEDHFGTISWGNPQLFKKILHKLIKKATGGYFNYLYKYMHNKYVVHFHGVIFKFQNS